MARPDNSVEVNPGKEVEGMQEEPARNGPVPEMQRPRGILLDLGNTLLTELRFDPSAGTDRLIALSDRPKRPDAGEIRHFINGLYRDIKKEHEISRIEWPIAMLQKVVYEIFGIKSRLTPGELEREFWAASSRTSLEPGVKEALDALAREGIPLGIISNSAFSGKTLLRELEKHGISDYFEFLISSSDYGVRKPYPALFLVGSSKLSLPARSVWFIGNSLHHDIEGAMGVGMGAVWYNREGDLEHREGPWLELGDWHHFPALLKEHL